MQPKSRQNRVVGHNRSNSTKRKRCVNTSIAMEPLPPPPPPPPDEYEDMLKQSFFKRSFSSPGLMQSGKYKKQAENQMKLSSVDDSDATMVDLAKNDITTLQERASGRIAKPLTEKRNFEKNWQRRENVVIREQACIEDSSFFYQKQSQSLMQQELIKDDAIVIDRNSLVSDKQNSSDIPLEEGIDKAAPGNKGLNKRKVICDETVPDNISSQANEEKKLIRPTSLFTPGQPRLFIPNQRKAFESIGAIQELMNHHYKAELTMNSHPHGSLANGGARRKRRPLPTIPPDAKREVQCRDVGVMTPGHLDDSRTTLTNVFTPLCMTPITMGSYLTNYSDDKTSIESTQKPGCYRNLSGKCKFLLLLVPTLIAVATTTVLVLFLIGTFGDLKARQPSMKHHVTPGLRDWTSDLPIDDDDRISDVNESVLPDVPPKRNIKPSFNFPTNVDDNNASSDTQYTSKLPGNDVVLTHASTSNTNELTRLIKTNKDQKNGSRAKTKLRGRNFGQNKGSKKFKISKQKNTPAKTPRLKKNTATMTTKTYAKTIAMEIEITSPTQSTATKSFNASRTISENKRRSEKKKKVRRNRNQNRKHGQRKKNKERSKNNETKGGPNSKSKRQHTKNLALAGEAKHASVKYTKNREYHRRPLLTPDSFSPLEDSEISIPEDSMIEPHAPYQRSGETVQARSRDQVLRRPIKNGARNNKERPTKKLTGRVGRPSLLEPPDNDQLQSYQRGEFGSAEIDDVSIDDEDNFADNDVDADQGYAKPKTIHCQKIRDPVCDAVLPYFTSLRGHDVNTIQSERKSLLVSRLKRDGENNDVLNSTSCDPESALRFLCSLQYPNCIEGSSEIPVLCFSWCTQILTSCLSNQSMTILNNLRHDDVMRPAGIASRSLSRHSKSSNQVIKSRKSTNDVDDLATYTCNVVISYNNEMTSSSSCVDMSSIGESFLLERDFSITPDFSSSDEAPPCGEYGFLCLTGECIDIRWRCDGTNDCGESEDETDCECKFGQAKCQNGQCIEKVNMCDGFYDCYDRTDEMSCDVCSDNMKRCGDGEQCIFATWWCDGDVDCINQADEANCSCETKGLFTCEKDRCIPPLFICDGDRDCSDGSDESHCFEENTLRCKPWMMTCEHSCISITQQCNGILDCSIGEDEKDCGKCEAIGLQTCSQLTYNVTMLPNFLGHKTQSQVSMSSEYLLFTAIVHSRCHPLLAELGCSILAPPVPLVGTDCLITGKNYRRRRVLPCRPFCLEVMNSCESVFAATSLSWPAFLNCDAFPENANGSIETCLDSNTLNKGMCSSDEFRCVNKDTDDTQCVTMMSRCDGKAQCSDGSDESDCDCDNMNRFQCVLGGKCIAKEWVCDSHNDCVDGSDEDNCNNCSSLQRSCSDYSCVSNERWCDGYDDCPDGSDEMNCLMLVPRGRIYNTAVDFSSIREANYNVGVLLGYDSITSQWLPLCADAWDAVFSHLACNQMGFSDAMSFTSLPFYSLRHHSLRHQPIQTIKNHRIRRIQESFARREGRCRSNLFIHVTCRARTCGRRRDVTDNGSFIPRIMGGRTSREDKWPWLASLQLPGMNHVCGATLVRSQWIVSAAHCFQERKDVKIWRVKIVGADSTEHESSFNLSKIIIHPRYDSQAVDFDVALIKLDRPIRSSNAEPLCLPKKSFNSGSFCVIAGWGLTGKTQRGARKLQEGVVHVINRGNCQRYYPNHVISNRMICAGRAGKIDACSGDSGGPLMCWQSQNLQWQLAGVTSWGSSCTPNSAPGVYTDIKYFGEWVQTTMEQKDFG